MSRIMESALFSPSRFRAWFVVFSASLFFFYEFVQINMFNAISDGIMNSFALTATQLGNLAAMYLYSTVLCLFPIGLLLDRFSTRKLIISAMCVCIICTILFALSTSLHAAMILRFIAGASGAFCFLSTLMLATRWFPNKQLALVTGLIVTVAMLGGVVAQTPLTLLAQHFNWRIALFGNVLLGIIFLSLIICFVENYPNDFNPRWHHKNYELGLWQSIKGALKNTQNWICGGYACLLNLLVLVLGAVWGSNYLVTVHYLTRAEASYITTMIFLGNVVGCPVIGWLSDKMGRRKLPLLIFAFLSCCLMSILNLAHPLSFHRLLILFFSLGFITSAQVLCYPMIAENNPRNLIGASEGIVSAIIMAGGAVFQPFFGWIMDLCWNGAMQGQIRTYNVTDYQAALLILPAAFLVSFILALFSKETFGKSI